MLGTEPSTTRPSARRERWTTCADPEAEDRVDRDLRRLVDALQQRLDSRLHAVLLLGGYARGEGSVVRRDDGALGPYNDYDLIAVVGSAGETVRRALRRFGHQWSERLGVEVDVHPVTPASLRRLPATLLWLDASLGGVRLLAGEHRLLATMRRLRVRQLPLDECGRLLANRAVGLALSNIEIRLGATHALPRHDPQRSRAARHIHKAVLACGDARLIAACTYPPTLAERADALAALSLAPGVGAGLVEAYRDAVAFRARPDCWQPPRGDLIRWYGRMRAHVARWHLEYESWRVGAPQLPNEAAHWRGPFYPGAPDLARGGWPAHLRAALRRAAPLRPYVGHPRERLARVAIALAYGDHDSSCRRRAAELLGVRRDDDEGMHARIESLTACAG